MQEITIVKYANMASKSVRMYFSVSKISQVYIKNETETNTITINNDG